MALEQVAWPAYKEGGWQKQNTQTHSRKHRLVQSPWLPHRNPDAPTHTRTHTHTHTHIHAHTQKNILSLLVFSVSLSLDVIYDLVFSTHSISSWMQVSRWLFAVFCLQGPRGLVGPRGAPGPPGQPVSQQRLDYRIRAIQSFQHYQRSSTSWNYQYANRETIEQCLCFWSDFDISSIVF